MRLAWMAAAAALIALPAWGLSSQEEANAALAQRYFRLMFEVHDTDAAAALLADDYVSHHQPAETKAQMLARFRRLQGDRAPDANAPHNAPRRLVVQGDLVFMLLAVPPRPDRAESPKLVFELYRVQDGRIAEHWDAFTDDLPPAR